MLVTRFAPTPSGYLHAGNAVNAVLVDGLTRAHGGHLVLRIDDFDATRIRPEYVRDVFDSLDWLGITPDDGPRDPGDFADRWSMAAQVEELRSAALALHRDHPGLVFACRCSRRELAGTPDGGAACVAGCRAAGHRLAVGESALRLHVPEGLAVAMGVGVPVPAGDHVLWRRDDLPSYHLGSVLADERLGITDIVRGADLLASSALQRHLAALLPAAGFLAATLHHHDLLTDAGGHKLSKSAGHGAHPMRRDAAALASIRAAAARLAPQIGLPGLPDPSA